MFQCGIKLIRMCWPWGKGSLQKVEEGTWTGLLITEGCCYPGGTAGISKTIYFLLSLGKTVASGKEVAKRGVAEGALGEETEGVTEDVKGFGERKSPAFLCRSLVS